MLMKSQLRWAEHVSRMGDYRLPKMVLYGKLSTGHRDRKAPKARYEDSLKKSLSTCHIDHSQWSTLAADRAPGVKKSTRLLPLLRILAKSTWRKNVAERKIVMPPQSYLK